jgi:CRISPR-associated protein Cmr5
MRLEKEFASKIYNQVFAVKDLPDHKKYGSMAYALPILVRTAGLAQALAFVTTRGKNKENNPYDRLLDHLAEVVGEPNRGSLLKKSREAGLQEYMYLTRRTMLALKWYKRFAESVLEVTSTDQPDEGGES